MHWCSVLWGAVVVLSMGGLSAAAEPLRIVEDGRPRAAVMLPAGCDPQTRAAAELLVRYVKQSSGAELPIVQEPAAAGQPATIHVGADAYVKGLDLGLAKLDADGFVLRASDGGHVAVAGPTPWGTEFGVCEFLERDVGVRWLMPGADGDDVPGHKTIEVPLGEVRQEPVFFSRLFSGLSGGQSVWARRNRMHGRVEFHHNLQRLFAPETYAKTHPEFYPIRKGQRYIPPDSETHGWQPCFSAEGIVEEAVESICRYFDKHPEATSYSLGVVDSSGHCECEKCQALDTGQKDFLGYRDCSDRYYGWCNRVVEGVLKKHPDKFFGCLAMLDPKSQPVSKDPSLEAGAGKWPSEWSRWITEGAGKIEADPAAAHSGKLGALCRGVKRGGPHQTVPITPGRYGAVALVRVPREPAAGATIALSTTPLDEQGRNLPEWSTKLPAKACSWMRIRPRRRGIPGRRGPVSHRVKDAQNPRAD